MESTVFQLNTPEPPDLGVPLWVLLVGMIALVLGLGALIAGVARARARIAVPGLLLLLISGGLALGFGTGNPAAANAAAAIQTRAWPDTLTDITTDLAKHYNDIRNGTPVDIDRANGRERCVLDSTGVIDGAVKLTLFCRPGGMVVPANPR